MNGHTKRIAAIMIAGILGILMCACGQKTAERMEGTYVNITAEEAKKLMDTEENAVILDVRTQEEFDEGHIPGAVLLPDYEVAERAESVLPDQEQLILVYCRSGRRSKNAADALAKLGYTNVREFGGIIDWPYETVKD